MICDREVKADCDNKLRLGFMSPIPLGERAGAEFGTGWISSRVNDSEIEAGLETAWPHGFTLSFSRADHTASKVRVTDTRNSLPVCVRARPRTSEVRLRTTTAESIRSMRINASRSRSGATATRATNFRPTKYLPVNKTKVVFLRVSILGPVLFPRH